MNSTEIQSSAFGTPSNTVIQTMLKTTGSVAFHLLTSNLGRKALFTGALYLAGGTLISTVGFVPVITIGALLLIL